MVDLSCKFSHLMPIDALVVGDLMLDCYLFGSAKRISPEAPVPVVCAEREEARPGGAGNVVLNLLSLGAGVAVLGRIGQDGEGELLSSLLRQEGAQVEALFEQDNYPTPTKRRIIVAGQQLMRIDREKIIPLNLDLEEKIIAALPQLLRGKQVVAISDYGKGFLSARLLKALIAEAASQEIMVLVDPKGLDFTKYAGATLIKPNLIESYAAAKMEHSADLDAVAQKLLLDTGAQMLVITRSQEGISCFLKEGGRFDFPVIGKEVKDVTGAGDTVLAMLAVALANGLDIRYAVQLANAAAGLAIEELGCYRVTLPQLARRLFGLDGEQKIFEETHLYALKQVLQGQDFRVLRLFGRRGLTGAAFRAISRLKAEGGPLIVYLQDTKAGEDFLHLLSSLKEVDYIVMQKKGLQGLCEALLPVAVYDLQDDAMLRIDPQELLN